MPAEKIPCVYLGADGKGSPGGPPGLLARCSPRENIHSTVQEVQSKRGGAICPRFLLLFWAADGLAAGLQVEIDGKGGQCAFHAEAVAAFLWLV